MCIGFRIIAVGYEARAYGVNRRMRGDEAKLKCSDIHLIHVPELRGKADLTRLKNMFCFFSVLFTHCDPYITLYTVSAE